MPSFQEIELFFINGALETSEVSSPTLTSHFRQRRWNSREFEKILQQRQVIIVNVTLYSVPNFLKQVVRLTLHPKNDDSIQPIRLLAGQSCTVGASPAADYHINSTGVDAIHCRFTCRGRFCFTECLRADATIVVNSEAMNRARLIDGDQLTIGTIKFFVQVSEPQRTPKVEMSIDFDEDDPDEDRNLTDEAVADSTSFATDLFDSTASIKDHTPIEVAENPLEDSPDEKPDWDNDSDSDSPFVDSTDSFYDLSVDDEDLAPSKTNDEAPTETDELENPAPSNNDSLPTHSEHGETSGTASNRDQRDESDNPAEPTQPSKPLSDSSLSDSTDIDPNQSDSTKTDSTEINKKKRKNHQTNEAIRPTRDRYFKAYNDDAVRAKDLLQNQEGTFYYKTERNAVVQLHAREIDKDDFGNDRDGAVVLFSRLSEDDLNLFFQKKRWHDRIRYPLGIQRFLMLSPQKIIDQFFEKVDACLIILEHRAGFEWVSQSNREEE